MKALKKRLDDIFSLYIRLRDCPGGHGRCISCGAAITPKTGQCGHFITRATISTRWDEFNCNAQCFECNIERCGNIPGYTEGLRHKYGKDVIDQLNERRRNLVKMGKSDYEHKIKYYTRKAKEAL